jgi:hypothetical protein
MMKPDELMPMVNESVKKMLGEQAMQIAIQAAQIAHLQEQLRKLEEQNKPLANGKDKKHGDIQSRQHDS